MISGCAWYFPIKRTTDDGTPLIQSGCKENQGSQQWQFRALGGNLFAVTNNYVDLEWNVTGGVGATGNGVMIQGWGPFNGQKNEEWYAVYEGTDSIGQRWEFIAANSGLCLTYPQSGNQFQQNTCNNVNTQTFYLMPRNPVFTSQVPPTNGGTAGGGAPPPQAPVNNPLPANTWNYLVNKSNGLCVDVAGGTAYNGAQLDQYPCGIGKANQQWKFTRTDSGYYRVVSKQNESFVWDVGGGPAAVSDKTYLDVYTWNAQTNQQWMPSYNPDDGTWSFQARNSGKCLDVPMSKPDVGLQLEQYDCNSSNAQRFFITIPGVQFPGPTPNDPTKP